jgi:dTDP-4-amino-4,6-dideoxygalactose transaminase
MNFIPYGRQYIDNQDISLVSKSLRQDLITTGYYVKRFENKILKFLKTKYAVSCSSGTSALHLSLIAINLRKDDVIIMPAINFIAAYNVARLMDAKILLADVDPVTGQMTPKTLLECIRVNKLKKIKAIITMYLGGYPENVIEFYNIKKKFNCYLIEDACHAFGAKYIYKKKYLPVGCCKHSDISTFSLHPVKTVTTGEGGLISTNDKDLANKIILFRSHGIERKKFHWQYNIKSLGLNYRLSDINCALGISQLKKINKFINYRKKIFNIYKKKLEVLKNIITIPTYNSKNIPSHHLFVISINFNKIKKTKNDLLVFLKKNKIIGQFHYIPIYKFDLFNKKDYFLKNSEKYFKNNLSLPIFYNLNLKKQIFIVNTLKNFFKKFN